MNLNPLNLIQIWIGNRVKSKKYGTRILEVVAQTVNEHQSGGREMGFGNDCLSSPGEGSATSSKRRREAEDEGWQSTRKSISTEVGTDYDDVENDFRQDNRQQTTKKAKQTNKGNIFYPNDK